MTDSSRRSQFGCNFDLILIKVVRFQSIFDEKINQSRLKDQKSRLKDRNY